MDALQFYVELIDRVSAPAGRGVRALAQLEAKFRAVDAASFRSQTPRFSAPLELFARGLRSSAPAAVSASDGVGSFLTNMHSALGIAGAFLSILREIGSTLLSVGRAAGSFVLEQTMFQQGTLTSLNTLLREQGPNAGRREFNRSLQLAALLPGENNEFVSMRRQLTAGGFTNARERDAVFALVQDIAQMNPEDRSIASRLATVLSQIRGADRVNGGDLLQLQNAGVFRTDVFDALARTRGMHGNTRDVRKRVGDLVSHGRIGGDEFIRAVAESVMHRTGGPLGQFALAQGNSLAGLLSNLESAPATLLQNLDLANLPGMQAVIGFLRDLNALLDASTPRGRRLVSIFERLINGVFGALVHRGDASAVFDRLLDVVEQLVPVFISLAQGLRTFLAPAFGVAVAMMKPLFQVFANSGNAEWFQRLLMRTAQAMGVLAGVTAWLTGLFAIGLVVVIGGVTEGIAQLWRGFRALTDSISSAASVAQSFFSSLWASVQSLVASFDLGQFGSQLMDGLAIGILNGAASVLEAVASVGNGVLSTVTTFFGIRSPSRLMMGLGRNVSLGFVLGIEGGMDASRSSLAELVRMPTPSSIANTNTGSLSIGSISLHFQLSDNAQAPDEIAREVERILPGALLNAFDQLAIERGLG